MELLGVWALEVEVPGSNSRVWHLLCVVWGKVLTSLSLS